MFGFELLDVLIGMALIYFILSILCSAVTEIISSLFKLRAHDLEESLKRIITGQGNGRFVRALGGRMSLPRTTRRVIRRRFEFRPISPGDKDFLREFKSDPLLMALGKLPSYLPAEVFSSVLLTRDGDQAQVVAKFAGSNAGQAAGMFIKLANGEYDKARKLLEDWFNAAMDRAGGWYKRMAFLITMLVALVVSFALNADTFALVDAFLNDSTARDATVAIAENLTTVQANGAPADIQSALRELCPPTPTPTRTPSKTSTPVPTVTPSPLGTLVATPSAPAPVRCLRDQLKELKLPIGGWDRSSELDSRLAAPNGSIQFGWPPLSNVNTRGWTEKSLGILVTAFALTLGAPFWFDLMTKLVNLRAAGKRISTEVKEEAKK